MVKPPKTMQPEGIEESPKKNPHRGGMDGDSFHHYMARKIELQRNQFGIQNHLPPPPSASPEKKVRFHPEAGNDMTSMLERLKQKHRQNKKRKRSRRSSSSTTSTSSPSQSPSNKQSPRRRNDLFFHGVVILVNGYTNPDNETLRRLLHQHGGDLETYETTRITHIIAQNLSQAKIKIYKKQRKPIPVVQPQWVVDCVKEQKLLNHGPYLLPDLRESNNPSVASLFCKPAGKPHPTITETQKSPTVAVKATERIHEIGQIDADAEDLMVSESRHAHDFEHPSTSLYSGSDDDEGWDDDVHNNNHDLSLLTQQCFQSPFATAKSPDTAAATYSSSVPKNEAEIPKDDYPNTPTSKSHHVHFVMNEAPSSVVAMATHDSPKSATKASNEKKIGSPSATNRSPRQEVQNFPRSSSSIDTSKNRASQQNDAAIPGHQTDTSLLMNIVSSQPNAAEQKICSYSREATESARDSPSFIKKHPPSTPTQKSRMVDRTNKASTLIRKKGVSIMNVSHADNDAGKQPQEAVAGDAPVSKKSPSASGKTDSKYIHGRLRTTGTDPDFLKSFFNNSRLSFIGSYQQRAKTSPRKKKSAGSSETSKRLVFHIDMDCFFASVVLRNYPQHQGKPVAISHYGTKDGSSVGGSKTSSSECATCNYEARKYGIKKGMFLGRARELCPKLIVLQYDFEGYEEVSESVADILFRCAQEHVDGYVEQVSCDEAYMELYLDDDNASSVHDTAKDIGERVRAEIIAATECTATVGIGPNKLLAKLGTDKVKPNGCMVVTDYRDLMDSLKLRDLHGIGYRSDRKLIADGLVTVRDVWDLGKGAEAELCRILGQATGKKIYKFCQGEDDREVKPAERKTIGAECNYGVRFDGPYGVDYMIDGLAKEIQKRMDGVGVLGSKLTLKVKQRKKSAKPPPKFLGHGSCHNLSKSIDISFPSKDWEVLSKLGLGLFRELGVRLEDVRGMGIVISKLSAPNATAPSSGTGTSGWVQSTIGHTFLNHESSADIHPANSVLTPSCDEDKEVQEDLMSLHQNLNVDVDSLESPAPIQLDIEDDIEIPPPSQLRLSQVEALPSPMKRGIAKRLLQVSDDKLDEIVDDDGEEDEDVQWKQCTVKQLFKLADLKSGRGALSTCGGERVSLTQLECLPLDMQLQIASQGELDSLQQRTHATVNRKKSLQRKKYVEPELVTVDEDDHIDETPPQASFECLVEKHRSFYQEQVAPLQAYLNDNIPSESKIDHVVEFLSMCVKEGQIAQVVKLLRSIENRHDDWSSQLAVLVHRVDVSVMELTGCRFDRSIFSSLA